MISEKMNSALNEQINKELYSAYLYLSMNAYFQKMNLIGFANWMNVQVQEETAHAQGLYNYVIARDGDIELGAIEKPLSTWNNALEVFEEVLKHEQFVTSKINALMDIAESEKDRAATSFLQWYIKEQVEEEANASGILSTLKLIKDDANALLLLDKNLATRTYVAPIIE